MSILALVLSTVSCGSLPAWACDAQAQTGIDPYLIYALCHRESSGNVKAFRPKDGHSASYGVCQIKMSTAQHMGYTGAAEGLMEPSVNSKYAARYLIRHLNRYRSLSKALSAYNAGRPIDSNTHYAEGIIKHYKKIGGNKQ